MLDRSTVRPFVLSFALFRDIGIKCFLDEGAELWFASGFLKLCHLNLCKGDELILPDIKGMAHDRSFVRSTVPVSAWMVPQGRESR